MLNLMSTLVDVLAYQYLAQYLIPVMQKVLVVFVQVIFVTSTWSSTCSSPQAVFMIDICLLVHLSVPVSMHFGHSVRTINYQYSQRTGVAKYQYLKQIFKPIVLIADRIFLSRIDNNETHCHWSFPENWSVVFSR